MMRTAPVPTGMAVLALARAGRFAEIRDMFAPRLRAMVSAEALQAAWAAELGRHGPVSSVGAAVSEPAGAGMVVVRIPVTFERGELTLVVSVDDAGWLAGLLLAPASAAQPAGLWEPPDYADPEKFDEQAAPGCRRAAPTRQAVAILVTADDILDRWSQHEAPWHSRAQRRRGRALLPSLLPGGIR